MRNQKIVKYFLELSSFDDADERTCKKFGITQAVLDYILYEDLVDQMRVDAV